MGSGYPDGWQEAFLICQSTINSWQAPDQLSVSKYSLGQSQLQVSSPCASSWKGQLQLGLIWIPNAEVILILLRKDIPGLQDQKSFTSGQNKGREAERQSAKGKAWFVLFNGVLLSSSSSLRWVFLPDIISFSGLAQNCAPDSFVLLTFGSTLPWLCSESCFIHINVQLKQVLNHKSNMEMF